MSKIRRYFADTEFLRVGKFQHELISLGIVSENPKDEEFYEVSSDFDVEKALKDDWIRENVLEQLPKKQEKRSIPEIIENMLDYFTTSDRFVNGDQIQLWVDVPAYDGYMIYELFSHIEKYAHHNGFGAMLMATKEAGIGCFDIFSVKQKETEILRNNLGLDDFIVKKAPKGQYHTAVGDARWARKKFKELDMIKAEQMFQLERVPSIVPVIKSKLKVYNL